MLLKRGPYGPYLQLGDGTGEDRPKRVSLPPGVTPESVDGAMAQALLDLPRALGVHPDSGETIEAHIGRFGPYVRHQRVFASLPKGMDVLEVDLATALDLLAKKRGRGAPRKTLGEHPDDGEPVTLHDGSYGPYVKHGKVNASLPEGQDPEALTLDEAIALIAARAAAKGVRSSASAKPRGAPRSEPPPRPKSTKAKSVAAKPARPKATPEDLVPFLDQLDPGRPRGGGPDRRHRRAQGVAGVGHRAPRALAGGRRGGAQARPLQAAHGVRQGPSGRRVTPSGGAHGSGGRRRGVGDRPGARRRRGGRAGPRPPLGGRAARARDDLVVGASALAARAWTPP